MEGGIASPVGCCKCKSCLKLERHLVVNRWRIGEIAKLLKLLVAKLIILRSRSSGGRIDDNEANQQERKD